MQRMEIHRDGFKKWALYSPLGRGEGGVIDVELSGENQHKSLLFQVRVL